MFSLDDYDYDLPPELIAQQPVARRDASRLLVLERARGRLTHRRFRDLATWMEPRDVLVVNDTAVVPGRLCGRKDSGGRVELLLLDFADARRRARVSGNWVCRCLVKASKRPRVGARFFFDQGLQAEVVDGGEGVYTLRFSGSEDFERVLDRIGQMPLPPYIRRGADPAPCDDRQTYQTVYAAEKGAIAAPTAGLHFTPDTLAALRGKGVAIVTITLHVGYGTFLPVRVDDIRAHRMHAEWFHIPEATAAAVNRAREAKGRVFAVGTTCVRTLEFACGPDGRLAAGSGDCDLFIYPGYRFRVVDAMVTNFHLPKSTLLMLVSAFAGRETMLGAYREAVRAGYRFYSYGDAMLIF